MKLWWTQFPNQLKLVTLIRFFASFGAGGVIYLTSLIFNNIGLSATQIGLGFTLSAIVGTLTRIITGKFLNKNRNISLPLKISSILSILASILLFISKDTHLYLIGQSFIGASAGIYWPSAEIAIPYLCYPIKTSKAYALVRSAEALGIFIGVFLGSFLNSYFYFKSIYINDILCMLIIIYLLIKNKDLIQLKINNFENNKFNKIISTNSKWHKNTKLIISSIILMTTCLALNQVTLPLDFVKGGINRIAIDKNTTGYILSLQLILLFIFQWPIGNWISNKDRLFGLKFSLLNFFLSSILFFASSYLESFGFYLMMIGIIFYSLAASSFLPTSSDIVFSIAPYDKRGFALAILSQCFALGYFIGPFLSGRILDLYGNASSIWITLSFLSLFILINIFNKKYED